MSDTRKAAPIRWWVVLLSLAAILLLAAGVCWLHWENAVSLRGAAKLSDYVWMETTGETLNLPTQFDRDRVHALYQDGEKAFALFVSDPWRDAGVLHIQGALLRLDQPVGEVNVRVGLIPEKIEAGSPAAAQEEAILLNTQMVRRSDYTQLYGYDDHCGFKATVQASRLMGDGWQYRVVLVDESDDMMRMFDSGMTVMIVEGGLAYARVNQPQEEGAHDEDA